jgi:hypothetical protein
VKIKAIAASEKITIATHGHKWPAIRPNSLGRWVGARVTAELQKILALHYSFWEGPIAGLAWLTLHN